MRFAEYWPVLADFGAVALVLGGIAIAVLTATGIGRRMMMVVGGAALVPPLLVGIGIAEAWQPGMPHDTPASLTALILTLFICGSLLSLWGIAARAMAGGRSILLAILGGTACLLLLPLSFLALLASGQLIAGASL